jgi:long-chain fatty acid transport protein
MKHFKIIAVSLLPVSAYCGTGTRIVEQDAAAVARGNAFSATADNPSAVYYNPAGITQLKGLQFRGGAYAVTLRSNANGAKNKHDVVPVPQMFATWTPESSPVSCGLGVYAPFGLSLDYRDKTPFRAAAKLGSISHLTVNPVVAWKVTPEFSLGLGAMVNYVEAELTRGILQAGDEFKLRGAGTSVGFNVGALWQPTERHSFGVRYHSATDVELSGHTSVRTKAFTVPTPFGPFRVPGMESEQDSSGGLRFPQFLTLGYSFRPAPGWNLEVGAEWTDWNALNKLTVHRQGADTVEVPFHWRSNWIYEAGITRTWENGWHASVGYIYAENVVPDETFSPSVPDSARHAFSMGFGYAGERWSFDLAYEYSHQPPRTISQGTTVDGTYQLDTHAMSLSAGVRF